MSDTLTAKQEAFCLAIMEGKSQHDAYKQSFSTKNYSREALDVNGSKMMAKAKIKQRIEALRSPALKKAQRSYGDWLQRVEDVAFVPLENLELKSPDMLKALELFGKATGYYQEKLETPMTALENTSTELLVAMLAELKARKAAREATIIDASHAEES